MNDEIDFTLNDGAVNFTLSDQLDFTLNDGQVNFKLNVENPEPIITSAGFDYSLDFGMN